MTDNLQKINLVDIELQGGNIHRSFLNRSIGLGDDSADGFGVRVFRNGVPVNLGDAVVEGFFKNPEGRNIAITDENVVEGNTAYVVLPQLCYAKEGQFTLAIKLVGDGVTGTMRIVDGNVDNTNTGSPVDPSGTQVPTYQEILAVYEQMQAAKEGSVRFDITQTMTDAQKVKAQENMGVRQTVIDTATNTAAIATNADAIGVFKSSLSWTDGAYINYNDEIVSHQDCSYSDYIELAPRTAAVIHTFMRSNLRTVLYNENKENIGTWANSSAVYPDIACTFVFNGSAAKRYIRVSTYTEFKADTFVATTIPSWAVLSTAGIRVESNNLYLPDCDDAEPNKVYTIATTLVAHLPDGKMGTLLCINGIGDETQKNGRAHLFVASDGSFYCRVHWGASGGVWTAWQHIGTEFESSGIEMFERFGVIGDSFASGVIYTPGVSSDNEYYPLSWPQVLARMSGNTGVNYSKGGYNTYDFVQSGDSAYNTYGLGKVLSDISGGNPCGLYILCMGINDSNKTRSYGGKTGGLTYLGSSADINSSDPSQNANSFWGNYGRIISAIKSASPNSRIVMCTFSRIPTSATSEAYDAYIEAIQNIAAYFSLPCITLTDDAFFNGQFYRQEMVGSHPTAPQYVGYAKGVGRLLSRRMVQDYSYFKEYTGV